MSKRDAESMRNVRLKLFLARLSEIRSNKRRPSEGHPQLLEEQEALVLISLSLVRSYLSADLNQGAISQLLTTSPGRTGTLMSKLEARGLVSKVERSRSGSYHRITNRGTQALAQYADQMLGEAKAIDDAARKSAVYQRALEFIEPYIDYDLTEKFQSAVKGRTYLPPASPSVTSYNSYTWDDILAGAEHVGNAIFNRSYHADLVLTFSGPASIFAGLVLTKAKAKLSTRVPMYIAFCLPKDSASQACADFLPVPTDVYTLCIPRALTEPETSTQRPKLAIIDDTIISGVPMRVLRKRLSGKYDLRIACCVCYEGRLIKPELSPDIFKFKDPFPKFFLPWGLESFSYDDTFP